MSRITINLRKDEETMKEMIKYLLNSSGNPYHKRTESVVAKMILEPALTKEYEKYLKESKQTVAS